MCKWRIHGCFRICIKRSFATRLRVIPYLLHRKSEQNTSNQSLCCKKFSKTNSVHIPALVVHRSLALLSDMSLKINPLERRGRKWLQKISSGWTFPSCLCKDAPSPKKIVSSGKGASVYMLGRLATFGK